MKKEKIPAQFQSLLWNQAICNWFDGNPDDLARFIENGWELNELQRNSIGKILRGEAKPNAKSGIKRKIPTLIERQIMVRVGREIASKDSVQIDFTKSFIKILSESYGVSAKTLENKFSKARVSAKHFARRQKNTDFQNYLKKIKTNNENP